MLGWAPAIRFHLAAILAAHWTDFVRQRREWIRPVVFENVRKVMACRTAVLGCHVYQCPGCGRMELVPHSCKSRFCPTCGRHATEQWADEVLNRLLEVPYHHLVLTIPWQLRIILAMNRVRGLNLLFQAATEAIQQWARDVMSMRMGIMMVLHTFGSDLKWNPHVHLVVTGGGLSLDERTWVTTDPRFLMSHKGLKSRWKYQVTTRLKQGHREQKWRFPKSLHFLSEYRCLASLLNKLWCLTWYAFIGASLMDPRFSVHYIGRYTKRAVLAEYRITHYDGKIVRFAYKDYAQGGATSYMTLGVLTFIGRLVRHIPDKHFPMIRHAGIFANRWKHRYLPMARRALKLVARSSSPRKAGKPWAERQGEYKGRDPLTCPDCNLRMILLGSFFGSWTQIQIIFQRADKNPAIPTPLRKPG